MKDTLCNTLAWQTFLVQANLLSIGDPDSWVHGRLLGDNVFDGVINSHKLKNTFYVEPATKFPQIKTNSSHIIYRYVLTIRFISQ